MKDKPKNEEKVLDPNLQDKSKTEGPKVKETDKKDAKIDPAQKLTEGDVKKGEGLDREKAEPENYLKGSGPLLVVKKQPLETEVEGGGEKSKKGGGEEEKTETPEVKAEVEEKSKEEALPPPTTVPQTINPQELPPAVTTVPPIKLTTTHAPVLKLPKLEMKAAKDPESAASLTVVRGISDHIGKGKLGLAQHLIGLDADLHTAATNQRALLGKAVITKASEIQVAAIEAGSFVQEGIIKETVSGSTLVRNAKRAAEASIDTQVQPHIDAMLAQEARVATLEGSMKSSIEASFDKLEALLRSEAERALGTAKSKGELKQSELQVAPAGQDLSDYQRRQNKAKGDAASKAATAAQEGINNALAARLKEAATARAKALDALGGSLQSRKTEIEAELTRLRGLRTLALEDAETMLTATQEIFDGELKRVGTHAKDQLKLEADQLCTQLRKTGAAYQDAMDKAVVEAQAGFADAAAWADERFGKLQDHFTQWSELESTPDDASLQAFDSALTSAQEQAHAQFSEHAQMVVDSMTQETTSSIDAIATEADNGRAKITESAGKLAKAMPEMTKSAVDGLNAKLAESSPSLQEQLASAPQNLATIKANVDQLSTARDTVISQNSADEATFTKEMNSLVGKSLDTKITSLTATAAKDVVKGRIARTWGSVVTAVAAVAATAFTIAQVVGLGLSGVVTLLAAAGIAITIGAARQQLQAFLKLDKLTGEMRAKEFVVAGITGVLGALSMMVLQSGPGLVGPGLTGLSTLLGTLQLLLATANETLVGTILARAGVSFLSRKVGGVLTSLYDQLPSSKSRKKRNLIMEQHALENETLEESVMRGVEEDNQAALDGTMGDKMGPTLGALGGQAVRTIGENLL